MSGGRARTGGSYALVIGWDEAYQLIACQLVRLGGAGHEDIHSASINRPTSILGPELAEALNVDSGPQGNDSWIDRDRSPMRIGTGSRLAPGPGIAGDPEESGISARHGRGGPAGRIPRSR